MSRMFQIHLKQSSVNKNNISVVFQVPKEEWRNNECILAHTEISRPISLFAAQETILTIILILFTEDGSN